MPAEPSLGWAAIDWIEHYLVHGPGDVQGQAIELDDEFAAFIVKAYRLAPDMGARLVRRAFLSRSKGRSKSGLAAFIECFEALGPCRFDHWAEAGEVSDWGYEYEVGEPVGAPLRYVEILNVATEESQAGNTYDAVYYALHPDTCSQAILDDFGRLDVGLTRINLPDARGSIEPVTASNEAKDGGKSTFIVADETHLWTPPVTGNHKLGKMHQTMVRNLLKRKAASGWMLETSTMYATGEGSVAEGTHDYAKSLSKADHRLLFDHRQASDEWDLSDRKQRILALEEAYGPAADWMDLEAIADYWDDPQATHAEFKRFWLNQPVPIAVPPTMAEPISVASWIAAEVPDEQVPAGKPDRYALAMSPERIASIAVALKGEQADYLDLAELTRVDDSRKLVEWLVVRCGRRIPVMIDSRDPAASFVNDLRARGVKVNVTTQSDAGRACGGLLDAVTEGRVWHCGQPAIRTALAVAEKREFGKAGLWEWDMSDPMPEIAALRALTLAHYGLSFTKTRTSSKSAGRKVVTA